MEDDQSERNWKIIEEAALTMLGAADEQAVLQLYRSELERLLLKELGDQEQASSLAEILVGIIAKRRQEIATSASIDMETLQ